MHIDIRHELAQLGQQLHDTDILRNVETPWISNCQLESFCKRNEALLKEARRLIRSHGKRVRASAFQERKACSLSDIQEQVTASGQLARAIHYSMESAIRDGHTDEARDRGLDLVMLGNSIRNGGCTLDAFLAICCEGLAIAGLRKIREQVALTCARELVELLEHCCRNREPFEQIWRRDMQWAGVPDSGSSDSDLTEVEIDGLSVMEADEIRDAVISFSNRSEFEKYGVAKRDDDRSLAQLRLLLTEVAVLCFRHWHGRLPSSLDELCPTILCSPPTDPFSLRALIYRCTDDGFVLYSQGLRGGGIRG